MIYIIGAGPIGCYTAFLLAKAGKKVNLFEEHKEIGRPIQCTGLITNELKKFIPLKKQFIQNKITKVKVNSKNYSTTFNLTNPELVIDREKFDKHLYNLAKSKGAKLFLNHKFLKIKNNQLVFQANYKSQTKSQIKSRTRSHKPNPTIKIIKIPFNKKKDILIGADGPSSKVSKIINKKEKKYTFGMQARIKTSTPLPQNLYQVFLGKEYGSFSWLVPEEKNIIKIGTLTKNSKQFKKFINDFKKTNKGKIIDYPSGIIPIYKKTSIQKNNIYLVGDSASQIKNTTGGGIIYGLHSAKILANSIIKKQNYQKQWNKKIKFHLISHNLIYKLFNKFTDKDFNLLIKLCSKKQIKKIIQNADREKPIKMLFKLIKSEPKFLLFTKKLFML